MDSIEISKMKCKMKSLSTSVFSYNLHSTHPQPESFTQAYSNIQTCGASFYILIKPKFRHIIQSYLNFYSVDAYSPLMSLNLKSHLF
jgi:hypothetical protein